VSATGCSQPPYPALTQTTRAIKKRVSGDRVPGRDPVASSDVATRRSCPHGYSKSLPSRVCAPVLSDSGTSPIFDRLSDRAGVNGQVAAMLDVDQDTLEEMLILVSIVVVIAMLLWKAFRSSKAR